VPSDARTAEAGALYVASLVGVVASNVPINDL
jgi:hypothetical protein